LSLESIDVASFHHYFLNLNRPLFCPQPQRVNKLSSFYSI
jgi:hypothetical protein